MASHAWRLIVVQSGRTVAEHALPAGLTTVGREPANDVVLDSSRVSRHHALFSVGPDGACHVQDLGSKNGVRLAGGARITRARVAPGDCFRIGPFECRVTTGDPASGGLRDHAPTESAPPEAGAPAALEPEPFLGSSPLARRLLEQAGQAAATELNVLVRGETGCGKGIVARLLHRMSRRARGPFVVVNCAAIPGELAEAELFGHRKGAFTGALADRPGKFRAAHGGTLFLDEIGDLPPAVQAKILRAIEDREVEPVGEPHPVAVDVRILAATHRDLEQAIRAGSFRLDLYHRLSTLTLDVPPLRERRDDIVLLANLFLASLLAAVPGAEGVSFSSEALSALVAHPWPGNVRELRNVVAQALVARPRGSILPSHLRLAAPPATAERAVPGEVTLAASEAHHVREALERHGWNLSRTARALGIARNTLKDRIARFGIVRPAGE